MGIKIWNTDISSIILWPATQPTPRLPAVYQEVEYIESHWEEYIDTWVPCMYWEQYSINVDFQRLDQDEDPHYIFWYRWHMRRWLYLWFSYWDFDVWDWGSTRGSFTDYLFTPNTYGYNTRYNFYWEFNTWQVDWESNLHLFIWCPDIGTISAKLYSCEVKVDWAQVRNFVPCYRKSDWEIWLYDLVNDVFYTNQWSWAFTKWPPLWCKSIKKVYRWSTLIWPSS